MKFINTFKTHIDIGFTDLAYNVLKKYRKMLEQLIHVCDVTKDREKGQRFVWTMSAWPMLAAIEKIEDAVEYDVETRKEIRRQVENLIKQGQIVIHALPFTMHTEFLSEQDFDHLFDSADEFCEKYGVKFPIAAKMTDVPGHTCALIAPLVKKGVKFLHLGANSAATKPKVPTLFWWEDMSGNRILTFYSRTYGNGVVPPKDWKFPVWLVIHHTADNVGPQGPEILGEIERTERENDDSAEIVFGSLDDFYNELSQYDLRDIPTIKGDLGDTWIHGVGSYPKEVSLLRRSRNVVKNVSLSLEEEKKFYENSLLFTEHTWGCNVQVFMRHRLYEKTDFLRQRREGAYILPEASWQEQRARAFICADIAEKYSPLYNDVPVGKIENDYWKIENKDGLRIVRKKDEVELVPHYEYETVGMPKIRKYLDEYLQSELEWALSDNGREDYFEQEDKNFLCESLSSEVSDSTICAEWKTPKESYEQYGNAERVKMIATLLDEKVYLRVILKNKHASPIVEGGNLIIRTNLKGEKYRVKKVDQLLDVEKDVVEGANSKLFCVSDFVKIDDVAIDPIDSPLVSFGESAVYRYQAGKFEKPKQANFVFNLFNNQWGTNFPQWTEADELIFDYVITTDNLG